MKLELDTVSAAYGETVALRNVHLTVPDGAVVALLGPNGAGKTTLLSVASGLVRSQHGRVVLAGEDVTSMGSSARARRGLCHVTEGRSIFRNLSVAENLRMFGGRSDGEGIDRALDAFPRLGERMKQIAGTLSGGEQQMLALSRVYASGAPLVLLDEVSLGLAPIVIDEIFDFLRRLSSEGVSVLLVEQYVAKALAFADYVFLLARGSVVFVGEPRDLDHSEILERYLGREAVAPATAS